MMLSRILFATLIIAGLNCYIQGLVEDWPLYMMILSGTAFLVGFFFLISSIAKEEIWRNRR